MVKTVIFDIDNTLYSYDDAHKVAWKALCAYSAEHLDMDADTFLACHKTAQNIVKARLGTDCAALHNRQLRYQVLLEENGKPLCHAIAMNDLYWNTLIGAAKPMPGILECLAALKEKGYILGIGTDMTVDYQLKKLVSLQMLPYFDFIVSSEEVNAEKPSAKLFACCAQKANVPAEECLFIGDSLKKDYYGSSAAGMQSLWYCPESAAGEADPGVRKITHYDQLKELLLSEERIGK